MLNKLPTKDLKTDQLLIKLLFDSLVQVIALRWVAVCSRQGGRFTFHVLALLDSISESVSDIIHIISCIEEF